MKIIIKILAITLFLFANIVQAQFPIVRTVSYAQTRLVTYSVGIGDYIQDTTNQLDSYVGIWKYVGIDKTLTLKLDRVNQFLGKTGSDYNPNHFYIYIDEIILTYKLEDNNGSIIFDNTILAPVTEMIPDIGGYLNGKEDAAYINGVFKDYIKNVIVGRCEIKKIPTTIGQPEKIYFELFENHSSLMRDPTTGQPYVPYIPGQLYSVPNRIELIKQ